VVIVTTIGDDELSKSLLANFFLTNIFLERLRLDR
jgi:hypothetical protein